MTTPHSGDGDKKSDRPEGNSAAVRVRTDAASKQNTTKTKTNRVEGEANEPAGTQNPAVLPDSGEPEAAISDDAEAGTKAEGLQPATTQRWLTSTRAGAHRANGRRGGPGLQPTVPRVTTPQSDDANNPSDQRDETSVEGEAKDPTEATDTAGAQDSGEDEAAISDYDAEAGATAEGAEPAKTKPGISWSRVVAYGVLPGLTLSLALGAGYLKWQDFSVRGSQIARIESVAAAKDSTIAMLSYRSDTVEKDLDAAKNRLTGTFKQSYSQLIKDVVIPGSKREHISTTATVPAASSVSATPNHAVALLFVNQTAVVDKEPPGDTASSVRVTLDKIAGRWLISGFDPV